MLEQILYSEIKRAGVKNDCFVEAKMNLKEYFVPITKQISEHRYRILLGENTDLTSLRHELHYIARGYFDSKNKSQNLFVNMGRLGYQEITATFYEMGL